MERLKETILVTGGTGFIGSHLVAELTAKGYKTVVVDIEHQSKSFFGVNKLYKKSHVVLADIRDRTEMEEVFKTYKPSAIFHLAAEPIVSSAYSNPYNTLETNIMGTVNILEAARKYHPKTIIVASSDKAYGKTKKAYTEESSLTGDHPYDVSKSCADLISQSYHKTYNMPIAITRFGNVYGEGDLHYDRIIPGILKSIIKDETLPIRSDGTYVRDYLYVKDVAKGYMHLFENFAKAQGEAYNFAADDTYSVIDIIKKVEKILNKKVKYEIQNTAKNEIPYQHLDNTKIKKMGWIPQYSIDSVIPDVLAWYKEIL